MENQLLPRLRFPEFEGEWSSKKLSDVGKIITGSTPSTFMSDYYENGKIHFVSPADIQSNRFITNTKTTLTELGFSKTRHIKENSVLFVCIGSTIGKVAQASQKCATNQQINAIECNRNNLNSFLYSLLEIKGNRIKLLAGNQALPQINKTDFSKFKFHFPQLPEQQKIASFLSDVDDKITKLTKKKALLEHYKKGVMQKIFSQELRFKDDDGNTFPEWEEKRLGGITSLLKDGSHGTHKDYPSDYFLLSAKNVKNGKINYDETDRKISEEDYKLIYKNYTLQENDILLSIVGTIGRVAIFRGEKNIAFQRSVAFFRFDNINAKFIYQLMNASDFQKELKKRQVVSAQPGIYLGDLAKIHMQIPCVKEQTKIANFLSVIDLKIEGLNTKIENSKTFKKGLLQKMFV